MWKVSARWRETVGEVGVFSMPLSTSRAISQAAREDMKWGSGGTGGKQVDGCWLADGADTCTVMQTVRDGLRPAGPWVQNELHRACYYSEVTAQRSLCRLAFCYSTIQDTTSVIIMECHRSRFRWCFEVRHWLGWWAVLVEEPSCSSYKNALEKVGLMWTDGCPWWLSQEYGETLSECQAGMRVGLA